MDEQDCIKKELESNIIPILAENEIPTDLAEATKASDVEADPLENQKLADDNVKDSSPGLLTTNSAKFEYAQKIVNEVMKRVPIFNQTEEENKLTADKLRIRMMRIKNRILNDIKLPLEDQAVAREKAKIKRNRKYKRMIEKETPEQAAQRRKREAEAKCYHRNIQKELETPELLFERRNEKLKKRLERKATETPEERIARREQTRNYRLMLKARRVEKAVVTKPNEMVCAKTGIVYDRNAKKPKKKSKKNEKTESINEVKSSSLANQSNIMEANDCLLMNQQLMPI